MSFWDICWKDGCCCSFLEESLLLFTLSIHLPKIQPDIWCLKEILVSWLTENKLVCFEQCLYIQSSFVKLLTHIWVLASNWIHTYVQVLHFENTILRLSLHFGENYCLFHFITNLALAKTYGQHTKKWSIVEDETTKISSTLTNNKIKVPLTY